MAMKLRVFTGRLIAVMLAACVSAVMIGLAPASAINNWGTVTDNIDDSANTVDRPQSAASADGKVVLALYREYVGSGFRISYSLASVTGNSQTWDQGVVATPPSNSFDRPQVAMTPDGKKATAVWYSAGTQRVQSASATIDNGVVTWGGASTVSGGSPTSRVTLSDDGTRAFSLSLISGGSPAIVANTATISGTTQTWGTETQIGTSGWSTNSPTAMLAADGLSGAAIWTERVYPAQPTDPWNVAARAFTISGGTVTWGAITPVTAVNTPGSTAFYPAAFMNRDGTKISAIWRMSDAAQANHIIQSASASISGTTFSFGTTTDLSTYAVANPSSNPQIAGSFNGSRVTATWLEGTGATTTLNSNSATISGTTQSWGTNYVFAGAGSTGEYQTKLTVSADGRIATVARGRSTSPTSLSAATGQVDGNVATWGALTTLANNNPSELLLTSSISGLLSTIVFTNTSGIASISGNTILPAPTVTAVSPNSGPLAGGGTVAITGTNLGTATTVTIGGQPCTDLVWDVVENELLCTVPAGVALGAVDVVVTTGSGSATAAGAYTYTGGSSVTHVPNKPRQLKAKGSPTSKKHTFTWTKPTMTTEGRPVDKYRLTIVQKGPNRLILQRSLASSTTKFTVSRKYLLQQTFRARGDMPTTLRYRVKVEALNSLGGGPISATNFRVRV